MASFNKFIGMGNLTRDPETRYTPQGVPVCSFGIAMNHKYKQGDETKEEVCYLDVFVFGKYADTCQKYLKKGDGAHVEGRIRQRRWNDKESGQPRTKHELLASSVVFLGKKDHGVASPAAPEPEQPEDTDIPF